MNRWEFLYFALYNREARLITSFSTHFSKIAKPQWKGRTTTPRDFKNSDDLKMR